LKFNTSLKQYYCFRIPSEHI